LFSAAQGAGARRLIVYRSNKGGGRAAVLRDGARIAVDEGLAEADLLVGRPPVDRPSASERLGLGGGAAGKEIELGETQEVRHALRDYWTTYHQLHRGKGVSPSMRAIEHARREDADPAAP